MRKILDSLASFRHYCVPQKDMVWKHMAYHFNKSGPGHTGLK